MKSELRTEPYHTPGTNKDTNRYSARIHPSFNIEGHGCILAFNKEGKLIR